MSAYAGKEDGRRFEPVRLGCVGEAPGDFWEQAVAQVGAGTAASGAEGVVAYLRRHAAEIGGGPSMGIMEAEQQQMYKVRMGSFPCAWSPAGPTRWRGCAAGSGRGSRCLPAPASRSGLRDAGSGGSASSRSTLSGRRAGA